MECKKNLTREQIMVELAKDDIGSCNSCDNLVYANGMLMCRMLSSNDESNRESDKYDH